MYDATDLAIELGEKIERTAGLVTSGFAIIALIVFGVILYFWSEPECPICRQPVDRHKLDCQLR